jgi:hypothetical protein
MSALLQVACSKVIRKVDAAPPVPTHAQVVDAITEYIDQNCEQLEIPVTHRFSPGVYCREITMPAGASCVGHRHKTRHQNIALTGMAVVTIDGVTTEIVAPFVFESAPGAQKMFQVIEDLRWLTIHANPTDTQDIVEIERMIFDLPPEMNIGIPVDEYRMTKRKSSINRTEAIL